MNHLEFEKQLVQQRIETHRGKLRSEAGELRRFTPMGAISALGRVTKHRLGVAAPLLGLFMRGSRWSTWLRVASAVALTGLAVAALVRRAREQANADELQDPDARD